MALSNVELTRDDDDGAMLCVCMLRAQKKQYSRGEKRKINIKACRGNDYGHNAKMEKQKTEQ